MKMKVEHEQKGKHRAAYGTELVKGLSSRLTKEFGSGFSERNLEYMRRFFVEFSPRIPQTLSAKLRSSFYNRLLRSYVIVDLKLDKLTHQDLGQMQMYVNHYDRHVKLPDENATIGLLLCKNKKDAVVKLTLPRDANIHAREYQLYLPSKELLKAKLIEWAREEEAK